MSHTISTDVGEMRWRDYVMVRGSGFDKFWTEHGAEPGRRLLFVIGRGFDPRAPLALQRVMAAVPACPIDVVTLEFKDESANESTALRQSAEANARAFAAAVDGRGLLTPKTVKFRNEKGDSIADRSAANLFADDSIISGYTDVLVDISAMPRVVYFPLVSRLIYFYDELRRGNKAAPNIHLIVSEDPGLDMRIHEHGIDEEASYLHPFEGPFNREAKGGQSTVWIPVLGEGRKHQFERMIGTVKPTEVCPVLPSPARNPRRCDDIVMEYQELLFDELGLDPRNIIYGSEFNPFDVYRQVRRTVLHYHSVLGLLGGCRVALSAICSKVMSLGILLVAYELKHSPFEVGIAHIECQGYDVPTDLYPDVEPVCIWAAGECYRKD